MRLGAEWMRRPADDMILETLRDQGVQTPGLLAEATDLTPNYCCDRARKLTEYGFTERIAHGLYRITDDGIAWLDEELDASEVEPIEE